MFNITKLADLVRDGLLLASSRTYAEQYVEPFIRAKFGLQESGAGDYDAVDDEGLRYEIKACKVLRRSGNGKGTKSLLDRILFENSSLVLTRSVPFDSHLTEDYLANVQNVKRDHFDVLIFALLFQDKVLVFSLKTNEIGTDKVPSWSDKHGRYDAPGKSGQFPITKSNIRWHLDHNLIATLDYKEVAQLIQGL